MVMRARIRTVKPEASTDEELWDLGQETGLPVFQAFVLLWCYADREGRFEWRPRALKAGCLPYWDGDFERVLDALVTRGFLVKYACEGRQYGLVVNFTKHQSINNKEPASVIPPPTEVSAVTDGSRVSHALVTGKSRVPDAPIPSLPVPDPDPVGGAGGALPPTKGKPIPGFNMPRDRSDVKQLHAAWKQATGLTGHSIGNNRGYLDAQALAEAIDEHGLESCLLVAKHCKLDSMVNGSGDERGQKHESIGYIFGNAQAFARILRTATTRDRSAAGTSITEQIAAARAL